MKVPQQVLRVVFIPFVTSFCSSQIQPKDIVLSSQAPVRFPLLQAGTDHSLAPECPALPCPLKQPEGWLPEPALVRGGLAAGNRNLSFPSHSDR